MNKELKQASGVKKHQVHNANFKIKAGAFNWENTVLFLALFKRDSHITSYYLRSLNDHTYSRWIDSFD